MTGSNASSRSRGFTLIIAVILAAVATAIGLALSSIAFKSVRLSDTAQDSSAAFYAADTGLECTLFADQKQAAFEYATHASPLAAATMTCITPSGTQSVTLTASTFNGSTLKFVSQSPSGYSGGWFPVAGGGCARITAFKQSSSATTLYAEGLNTCDTSSPRLVERGIYSYY
ncbi:MAG TPA: pilus assembly PilX N-terminal domain-containing protein [Candidatus Paceibacterota bacterium]